MELIDKSGKEIQAKELIPLVVDDTGLLHFLLRVVDSDTEYRLSFEVYEVGAWVENEATGVYDVPCDLKLYLSGIIKWDGCSHIYFGEEENEKPSGYLHLCGKGYWERHCQLMGEIYAHAEKTILKFSPDVAT